MNYNYLKQGSLVVIPSLFLLYLYKTNEKVREIDANFKQFEQPHSNKFDALYRRKKPRTYLNQSKNEAIRLIEAFRVINSVPGVSCGVSYQGKEMWSIGNGLADLETRAPCTDNSVMRIASISKPITMLLLGKLLEEGKIDLDKPIYEYLQDKFPQKYFDNQKVNITLRQLVSHLGGIRHYNETEKSPGEIYPDEFLLDKKFNNVYECLDVFKNDDLMSKPGTKYLYTTLGYTVISAVIQSILDKESKDKTFEKELIKLLKELGMASTYLDVNEQIIPNRVKYYYKKGEGKKLQLVNAQEINNSFKWAGGGLLSNVHDLLRFGNAMLYSYKTPDGILKQETVKLFWTPVELAEDVKILDYHFKYGMGWESNLDDKLSNPKYKGLVKNKLKYAVFHTGGALGAVSILIIFPKEEICLAIIANSSTLSGIVTLALNIAKSFHDNIQSLNDSIVN